MRIARTIILSIAALLRANAATAQNARYSGTVKDAENDVPIGYAAVGVLGTTQGVMTNDNGEFSISAAPGKRLVVSFIGYRSDTIKLGARRNIELKLKPEAKMLKEVVVKRKRYTNKNNPAVTLIRNVIAHKEENTKQTARLTHTRKYDKTMFALNDISEKQKNWKILKKVDFVFDNTDTTLVEGKEVLPFYVREEITDIYSSTSPKAKKVVTDGERMVKVNGLDVDNEGLAEYSKHMYQDINLYDNTITFLTNGFLSPIASTAPSFYRYYIQDTVMVDGEKCVKLFFASRSKADQLFTGHLYITTDSTYAVKKAEMTVDGRMNLNWVRGVSIVQEFKKSEDLGWTLSKDYLMIDFIVTNKINGIVGERSQVFREMPEPTTDEFGDSLRIKNEYVKSDGYDSRDQAYWDENRLEKLPQTQEAAYQVMDSVQKVPMVKGLMIAGDIIGRGYINLGKVEIGPLYGFYGHNAVEGHRVRFGGRTTDKLTKRANFEAYGAYGFGDNVWKYYGKASFSFTKKSIHEFPVRSISLSYYNDTRRPGQESNVNENSVFQAIGRDTNHKLYYDETITLQHLFEFKNHFSYNVGFKYMIEQPGGDIYFNYSNYNSQQNNVRYLNTSEAFLTLRWAPKERFYQGRTSRHILPSPHPIFTLKYQVGSKLWGNDYDYHWLKLSIYKRFYLSVFGTAKVNLEGGYMFGKASFPTLTTHASNQSFLYLNAYNLMNYLEFVSDKYVSLWIDYDAEGFFLNKIPVIRRLKLRDVATIKVLYGGVGGNNDPDKNNDVFKFPVKADGTPMTYTLGEMPYIEGSIGLSNILKVLRVDFVKRFTYLNNPKAPSWGIRIKFDLDF
ncbi:MAG: carboxypeptidase-like regulatory domain-containing protein [Paludibacteraceae bacterium]|nr:carboxypeptidase-like regulatory domain-containing protein [Paludibacteraceae bacterium]